MGGSEMTLDVSQVLKGLKLATASVREGMRTGLAQAGMALLRDCVMDEPTVPLKEGTLRGSGSVFVNNELVQTSVGFPGAEAGTPCTDHQERIPQENMVAVVGFNTPYAEYIHEGVRLDGTHKIVNWSEPGSGKKFMESKLLKYGKKYIGIVQRCIQEALEAGW